jgi:hypothetical protein
VDRRDALRVGVAEPGDAVAVARRLVDDGAQLVEVCGAFGPLWTARVVEAVGFPSLGSPPTGYFTPWQASVTLVRSRMSLKWRASSFVRW